VPPALKPGSTWRRRAKLSTISPATARRVRESATSTATSARRAPTARGGAEERPSPSARWGELADTDSAGPSPKTTAVSEATAKVKASELSPKCAPAIRGTWVGLRATSARVHQRPRSAPRTPPTMASARDSKKS